MSRASCHKPCNTKQTVTSLVNRMYEQAQLIATTQAVHMRLLTSVRPVMFMMATATKPEPQTTNLGDVSEIKLYYGNRAQIVLKDIIKNEDHNEYGYTKHLICTTSD